MQVTKIMSATAAGLLPKLQREQALRTCQYCQCQIEPLHVTSRLGQYYIPRESCTCDGFNLSMDKKYKEQRKVEFNNRFNQMLVNARVYNKNESDYGELVDMTLKSWNPLATNLLQCEQSKLSAIMKYVDAVHHKSSSNRFLVISGQSGVGKTHLAVGIIKRLVGLTLQANLDNEEVKPLSAYFMRWLNFVSEIKAAMDAPTVLNENLMNLAKYRQILVIDDITSENATDFVIKKLYEIIDYRASQNKATIITSSRMMDSGDGGMLHFLSQYNSSSGSKVYNRILNELWGEVVINGTRYEKELYHE